MIKSIIFICQILLETVIFPSIDPKLYAKTTIHFLAIVTSVYVTRNALKNYSIIFVYISIIFDYFLNKFLLIYFYDLKANVLEFKHSLLIITISLIVFSFTPKSHLDEFEQSKPLTILFEAFMRTVLTQKYFFFFNHSNKRHPIFHLEYSKIIFIGLIDLLINGGSFVFNSFFLISRESKEKKKKYVWALIYRYIMFMVATILYSSIFNDKFSGFLYEGIYGKIPEPHSHLIYNSFPRNKELRFKISLYFVFWLI